MERGGKAVLFRSQHDNEKSSLEARLGGSRSHTLSQNAISDFPDAIIQLLIKGASALTTNTLITYQ